MSRHSYVDQSPKNIPDDSDFTARLLAALPGLNAFSIALCGNRDVAKDLVQETILKALEKESSFQSDRAIKPWLMTILRNSFFSERRKYGREISYCPDEHEKALTVGPAQQVSVELGDFERLFSQLPPEQREVLMLIVVQGFSYAEAAEICNCLIGTIKSRLNRARSRLAIAMLEEPAQEFLGKAPAGRSAMSAAVQ